MIVDETGMHITADRNTLIAKGAIVDIVELVGSVRMPKVPDKSNADHLIKACKEVLSYLHEPDCLLAEHDHDITIRYKDPTARKWQVLTAGTAATPRAAEAMIDPDFKFCYETIFPYTQDLEGGTPGKPPTTYPRRN
jgi:hypothetical protein